jgi:hypothetical protein
MESEHHLDKIPKAELITKAPTYAQEDHLTIEVPTRKHCLRSFPITHTSTKLPKITLYPNWELAICARAVLINQAVNRELVQRFLRFT